MPLTRRALTLSLLTAQARAAELDLDALMAALAAVPERRAAFREVRRFAVLDQPLESRGHLLYRRPAYLEKVTEYPQPESLVVDGTRLILTQEQGPPRVIDLGTQPELRGLVDAIRAPLAGDLPALRRAFAVTAAGTLGAWTLDLVPHTPRLLRAVHVEGRAAEISEITLTQPNGDTQRLTILP